MQRLTITSRAFEQHQLMPAAYTCQGDNISPPLEIEGVPDTTKSFALIMEDPDAPGGLFVHWLKWNIPPALDGFEEGREPPGVSGKGSSGKLSYEGPCPPSGAHRYMFKVYALDTELILSEGSQREELLKAMKGHVVGYGELTGLYSKI